MATMTESMQPIRAVHYLKYKNEYSGLFYGILYAVGRILFLLPQPVVDESKVYFSAIGNDVEVSRSRNICLVGEGGSG